MAKRLSRQKGGRMNKKVLLLLSFKKKKDEERIKRLEREEELAQVLELNRETQTIEPPASLLDFY